MRRIFSPVYFVVAMALLSGIAVEAQTTRGKVTPKRSAGPVVPKQTPAPPMPILPDIRNDPDVQAADVALIANITIQELRFDAVPNPTVEFLGEPKTSNIWHADRYNLPDQVQPGVTYRNVGIRLKITSRLADIERIVAEALGEVPLTDNLDPEGNPSPGIANKNEMSLDKTRIKSATNSPREKKN